PLCTHCKTFGHSTLSCKFRPRTDDEIATNIVKEATNVNGSGVTVLSFDLNEGFVFMGKKNKPVITQNRSAPVKNDNYNKSNFYGMRGKGVDNGRRQLAGNQKQYGNGQVFNDTGNFWRNIQGNNASNRQMSNKNMGLKNSGGNSKYNNGVEWQRRILNLILFHLDPIIEDDEGDVESDVEGIAMDTKPEFDVNAVNESEINTATCNDVSNGSVIVFLVIGVRLLTVPLVLVVMHCFVDPVNGDHGFFCSFVYASVNTVDRRCLWKSLNIFKGIVKDMPWTILGDFNVCLDPSERSCGSSKFTTTMDDFRDCVEEIEVDDIAMTG
nr:hypothetical protein [Tanacetum cinerariifolium]